MEKILKKIIWKIKLKWMDDMYYFTSQNCFSLFPPSFYYTHTEEEVKRIKEDTIARIQKLLDELPNE